MVDAVFSDGLAVKCSCPPFSIPAADPNIERRDIQELADPLERQRITTDAYCHSLRSPATVRASIVGINTSLEGSPPQGA